MYFPRSSLACPVARNTLVHALSCGLQENGEPNIFEHQLHSLWAHVSSRMELFNISFHIFKNYAHSQLTTLHHIVNKLTPGLTNSISGWTIVSFMLNSVLTPPAIFVSSAFPTHILLSFTWVKGEYLNILSF